MQAIILAAGVGERLAETAGGKPKSLLDMGGETLLARHCRILGEMRIDAIHVVTGFKHELIGEELARHPGSVPVHALHNGEFRLGSVVSLWAARHILDSGDEVLLMDADVLCHPGVLSALVGSTVQNCFLLDRDFEAGDEPVKLCLRAGQVVEFRKQVQAGLQFDVQGESVGFFRFAPGMARRLAARCQAYLDSGRTREPYEEAIRDLALASPGEFGYEDITGLPWIEIDFPADVDRARMEILPRLPARGSMTP